jgi:hypothetical protein
MQNGPGPSIRDRVVRQVPVSDRRCTPSTPGTRVNVGAMTRTGWAHRVPAASAWAESLGWVSGGVGVFSGRPRVQPAVPWRAEAECVARCQGAVRDAVRCLVLRAGGHARLGGSVIGVCTDPSHARSLVMLAGENPIPMRSLVASRAQRVLMEHVPGKVSTRSSPSARCPTPARVWCSGSSPTLPSSTSPLRASSSSSSRPASPRTRSAT